MSFFYAGRTLERQFITAEINQRKEEGCDVAEISPTMSSWNFRFQKVIHMKNHPP